MSFARLDKTSLRLRYFFAATLPYADMLSALGAAGRRSPSRRGAILSRVQVRLPSITLFLSRLSRSIEIGKKYSSSSSSCAAAVPRVATQSPPPIEFDSFHSRACSPISRQNPSLVTTIAPSLLLLLLLVAWLSIPLGLLVLSRAMNRSGMHGNGYGTPLRAGRGRAQV